MGAAGSFEWKEEYGDALERIASSDIVETEWPLLRKIIKHQLDKNIASYLTEGPRWEGRPPLMIAAPQTLPNGGLKLPPFPPREPNPSNPNPPPPKVDFNDKEAEEMRTSIYAQLDDFEACVVNLVWDVHTVRQLTPTPSTPFTIQRICELCVRPRQHYKYVGKYLRAMEKCLLVTSSWNAFPPLSEVESTYSASGHPAISTSAVSAPNTPMFSPIPFLHEDARRSKSRSPPPSPLVLPETVAGGLTAAEEGAEPKVLGLVDELDDPSPGHLSDHIEPISATTTVASRPIHPTLEERFVKSTTEEGPQPETGEGGATDVPMAQEEDEGKENKAV
ncbi:PPP4R2-domain-containing protein [Trametes maxima]|nr:PPP4R2-domain-containing protein [Trametes maxima]